MEVFCIVWVMHKQQNASVCEMDNILTFLEKKDAIYDDYTLGKIFPFLFSAA